MSIYVVLQILLLFKKTFNLYNVEPDIKIIRNICIAIGYLSDNIKYSEITILFSVNKIGNDLKDLMQSKNMSGYFYIDNISIKTYST